MGDTERIGQRLAAIVPYEQRMKNFLNEKYERPRPELLVRTISAGKLIISLHKIENHFNTNSPQT